MNDLPISERLAAAARELDDQTDARSIQDAIVRLAVANVEGAAGAGVSVAQRGGRIATEAQVGDMVERGDQLQYELQEGPCLEAIWSEQTIYSPDLPRDPRWPTWGPRVAEVTGAHSVLSIQLYVGTDTLGALNLYSTSVDGFGQHDQDVAIALGTVAALALTNRREIDTLTVAIDSRTQIGQALGIIMERYSLTPEQSMSLLHRLSSHGNIKVRTLAQQIVETRAIPEG